MPQPLPAGKQVSFGPNRILERPDLAAQMAAVCANWSLIENDLMMLYSLLMGTYLPRVPGAEAPAHPVALQVFDALNTLHPRLDLLLRLCKWRALSEEAEQMERVIIDKIKKRFRERSVLAHGIWGISEDYSDALVFVRTFDRHLIYRKRDFEVISERVLQVHTDLLRFTNRICERSRQVM